MWTSWSAGSIDSDACWIQSQAITNCSDVRGCFVREALNGSAVERRGVAPSLRRRQGETAQRLWDQAALLPSTHNNWKMLVLRNCQIDSDETRSHGDLKMSNAGVHQRP